MKMDTSYWLNLNSKIKFHTTKKIFYKKYLWRVNLYIPGGRLILTDATHSINFLISQNIGYYQSRYFARRNNNGVPNVLLLEFLRTIKNEKSHDIKFRIERPWMQIFAYDEATLRSIMDNALSQVDNLNGEFIQEVTGPIANTEDYLIKGAVLRSQDPGYNYKIQIRNLNKCKPADRWNLAEYLKNLDREQVQISNPALHRLCAPFPWREESIIFYINDLNIMSFIKIIMPGGTVNIHEVIHINK